MKSDRTCTARDAIPNKIIITRTRKASHCIDAGRLINADARFTLVYVWKKEKSKKLIRGVGYINKTL